MIRNMFDTREKRVSFCKKIREFRDKKKMTAKLISEKIGISETSFLRIERNSIVDPREETLKKIAEILGVDETFKIDTPKENGKSMWDFVMRNMRVNNSQASNMIVDNI